MIKKSDGSEPAINGAGIKNPDKKIKMSRNTLIILDP
jgi:hypothetical protein